MLQYKPKQRNNPNQQNSNAKSAISQVSDSSSGNSQEIEGFMQSLNIR